MSKSLEMGVHDAQLAEVLAFVKIAILSKRLGQNVVSASDEPGGAQSAEMSSPSAASVPETLVIGGRSA